MSNQRNSPVECNIDISLKELPATEAVSMSNGVNATDAGHRLEEVRFIWSRFRDALLYVRREWRLVCELVLFLLMIIIVWGLLSLPLIFYYSTKVQVRHRYMMYSQRDIETGFLWLQEIRAFNFTYSWH